MEGKTQFCVRREGGRARLCIGKPVEDCYKEDMVSCFPETLNQLADRWTVLMNQVNRQIGPYPSELYVDVRTFIDQTESIVKPDPFEHDVLRTVRRLVEDGKLKIALFRLREVIDDRLEGRRDRLQIESPPDARAKRCL
ncbi:hypothetical protein [Caballeronia arationis]|uniref:hypothetical protein n=1 Tax=Caballeronia arationis TaxID=1777142 RepID=UPI00078983D1|nr:hypothetical protein [Caballeronia arationis]